MKVVWLVLFIAVSMTTIAKEGFIESGQAQLYYKMVEKESPIVVLHGGPGLTHEYLRPQLDELAQNHTLIFYDQRGCGRSAGEISPETVTIETYLNDIENIRKALGFDKVSVLGHSWGGFLAMHYAIAHPKSVNKLILANPMPANADGYAQFVQEWVKRTACLKEQLDRIHATQAFNNGEVEQYYRLLFRVYCHVPEKADLLSLQMTQTAALNGRKVMEYLQKNTFSTSFDLMDALKKLNIPTLIIHGDHDVIPPATAEQIHESIPGSKMILMEHCGHFPHVEKPEAFFKHINEFLSQ